MEHWFDKIAKGLVITWASLLPLIFSVENPQKTVPPPTSQIPHIETIATSTQTFVATSTQKIVAKKTVKTKELVIPKILPSLPLKTVDYQPSTSSPIRPWSEINTDSKSSIINILCTSIFGGVFKPASGTGIVISGNGLVLTAAHVGQFFLLKDYPAKDSVRCVARTGSPAKNEYELELVYLPPEWIENNLTNISDENPTGTGEYDFAILKIVRRINVESTELLPHPFPHLELVSVDKIPAVGTTLLQSAYPAGFLGGVITNLALYNASALTQVNQLFSFSTSSISIDLFGLNGTILAQKGSSGGAVITDAGKVAGVIVTSTFGKETSERTLRAITVGHIDRTLFTGSGYHLAEVLDEKDPTVFAKLSYEFNTYVVPQLTQALKKSIERN
ncbi:MAG: Trypsin-like peptidase domain [Candidatus Parcubacteria bacterium]|jgi:hypothetical protein